MYNNEQNHTPKYAAGGEMDRVARQNVTKESPSSFFPIFFLLVIGLFLLQRGNIGRTEILRDNFSNSSSISISNDFTCEYNQITGVCTVSGGIIPEHYASQVTVTLYVYANDIEVFTDKQYLGNVSSGIETPFEFEFNLTNVLTNYGFQYEDVTTECLVRAHALMH